MVLGTKARAPAATPSSALMQVPDDGDEDGDDFARRQRTGLPERVVVGAGLGRDRNGHRGLSHRAGPGAIVGVR